MRHILFIESNDSLTGIRESKELECFVTLLTSDLNYYLKETELKDHPLSIVDNIVTIDTSDIKQLIDFIDKYHKENPLTAVLTFAELYVEQATECANKLGLLTLNPVTARSVRNKGMMRKLSEKHGIPVPRSSLVESIEQAIDSSKTIGFPCIIKPCNAAMSIGVRLVYDENELIDAYNYYQDNRFFGRGLIGKSEMLIEEYAEGPIISIESITYDNEFHCIGITDRIIIGSPFFVEAGSSFPVKLENENQVVSIVRDALIKLDYNFGACHTEVAITSDGPKIIEINPRLVGGPVPQMIYHSTGLELPKEIIKMYLGEQPDLTPKFKLGAASREFCSPVEGELVEVEGLGELYKDHDIKKIQFLKSGARLPTPKSNFDWVGKIIVISNDATSAKEKIRQIEEKIKLVIKISLK